MDVHIQIEKKHFLILVVLIGFFGLLMLTNAAQVDINDAWHPLQQIAKSQDDKTSVDSNKNTRIDRADNATLAFNLEPRSDIYMNGFNLCLSGTCRNTWPSSSDRYLPDDPATDNVDMNGYGITNLQAPSSESDAATKNYVDDTHVSGGLYGYCKKETFEGPVIKSPMQQSGWQCECPDGYDKVRTGREKHSGDFITTYTYYYSCYKS